MFKTLTASLTLCCVLAGPVLAETVEVKMLNRGEGRDTMVFDPAFVRLQPGDSVKFIPTDKGHSAETDPTAWVDGAAPFAGKINEAIEYTFEQEGLYGVKCKPHYAMGMVMTIAVGDVSEAPEGWLEGRVPRKAKKRYEAQLEQLLQ